MPRLFGAQRLVLQAILDAQSDTPAFIEDTRVAQAAQIPLRDTRDWFLILDQDEFVDLALTEGGLKGECHTSGPAGTWPVSPAPDAAYPSDGTGQVPEPDGPGACPGHRHHRLSAADPQAARRRQRRAGDGEVARFGPGSIPLPERPKPCRWGATQKAVLEAIEKFLFSNNLSDRDSPGARQRNLKRQGFTRGASEKGQKSS